MYLHCMPEQKGGSRKHNIIGTGFIQNKLYFEKAFEHARNLKNTHKYISTSEFLRQLF